MQRPSGRQELGTKKKAMREGGQGKEFLERLVETCGALISGFVFILSPKSNGKTQKVR